MFDDLERFVEAQEGVHASALRELRAGCKTGHWIWFVFPQIGGLGHSEISRRYAIESRTQARAYLAHPVLGPRLRDSAAALLSVRGRSATEILGGVDAMKVRSSMTLFHRAAPDDPLFAEVLDRYYAGVEDELTIARLG